MTPDAAENGNTSIPRNDRLRERIVNLYKAILLYEMIIVASQCDSINDVSMRISGNQKVSDPNIGIVANAETALATFDSDDTTTRLKELMPPETRQERDPTKVDQRKTSENASLVRNFEAIDPEDTIPNSARNGAQVPGQLHIYQWLVSRTEYADFAFGSRNEGDNQLFWVSGGPGSGKTMLLASLVQCLSRQEEIRTKSWRLAYFFCKNRAPRMGNATTVLQSLIWQLIQQQPSLAGHLERKHRSTKRKRFDSMNDFVAISGILYDILGDQSLPNTYLVLDAVDKTPLHAAWPTAGDLLRFINMALGQFPRIKWVVSTESHPDIQEILGKGGPGRLHLDLDVQKGAIGRYINLGTSILAEEKQNGGELVLSIAEAVHNKSPENLLWAQIARRALSLEQRRVTPTLLNGLPTEFIPLCNKMMNIIREDRNNIFCILVLSVMAIAFYVVHITELAVLAKLPATVDVRVIVRECSTFLDVHDELVYFIHESIRDYITLTLLGPGNVLTNHATMAQKCVVALSECFTLSLGPNLTTNQQLNGQIQWTGSIQYSLLGWMQRSMELEDLSSNIPVLTAITTFLMANFLKWVEVLVITSRVRIASTMMQKLVLQMDVSLLVPWSKTIA